jgi:hypothetical protein
MVMNKNDHKWLISRRKKIQTLLSELYWLKKNYPLLYKKPLERSQFGLFVGAAFSLWRAAFLVDAKRDWKVILEKAEDVLRLVVEDNAINYQQDKEKRNWVVGFYLNNARYRLRRVYDKFQKSLFDCSAIKIKVLDESIDNANVMHAWDNAYGVLIKLLRIFRKSMGVKKNK